jgi:Tol biopolymer transport system component
VQFATLAPDGKRVAYNFIQNGIMNVWVAAIENGDRKQLSFDNEMAGFPCWSPDGAEVSKSSFCHRRTQSYTD